MRRFTTIPGRLSLAAVLAAVVGMISPAGGEEPGSLKFQQGSASLTIRDAGRAVLDYRYQDVPFKPYVASLTTPGGVQVLRDSPFDHKHHHGLMFAVAADRVNFWEERPDSGREVHREFRGIDVSARDGLSVARFGEQLDWIAPKPGVLLRETRTLTLYRGAKLPATLVTWSTRLEPAEGKSEVTVSGANYYGLGMRFLVSMDKVGEVSWADVRDSVVVSGDTRLTHSAWCAYTAPADGKPVTAALFDHPANPYRPARMFTMKTPFAYLSATMDLSKQTIKVTGQKPLAVRYGVAVWDGKVEPAQVESLRRLWLTLEP